MTKFINVNSAFESITQEPQFLHPARILWIDKENDSAVLITIEDPPKQPWSISLTELDSLLQEKKIRHTVIKVPAFMLALEDEIDTKAKHIRETSWERIQPLLETKYLGEIFVPQAMGTMIAAHAKAINLPRKTLYRLLYRYWLFGGTKNALLPNYVRSGGAGKAKTFAKGKINGRPPKYLGLVTETKAKILTEEDKAAIKIGYALYKNNVVECVTDAYNRTLNKFYRAEHSVPGYSDDDFNLKPAHELPKLTQFQYWGKKAFDAITVLRSRKGERKWEKDHRALIGRANQGLFGPCHRFEIDATIADVYLVSRFNRNWIIGRPVVYVVVDVFSRMIVGIYIGLEGPSWNGARQALWNAFSNKVDFCRQFDIQINPSDWPCHHLPQEICADRGEMLGIAAENLATGLGIDLAIAPPYRPDWKAIVESRFRVLNRLTQIQWAPGGVAQRIKERGERDYRLDATLDLHEFTKIMVASVLHYNRHSRQPDWLNKDMIAQEIDSTPISLWNWGIEHGFGAPNIHSPELVYLHLLPKAKASVQAGGIYFEGMFYTSASDGDGMKFARARAKGREPIDVWYDSTKPEHIWIRNEDKSFTTYHLRASEIRYRGHRLEEIMDMLEIIKQSSPDDQYTELVSKVQLDDQVQSIINQATAEKKLSQEDISSAQQVAGIRANRTIERAAERAAHTNPVVTTPTINTTPTVQPVANISETYGQRGGEVIDLLSRLRKK
ncbi:Mu transposase C-terminal domain-containing protein [Iodobacter fluviatilis]|uniref:Integrase-like protein n=1 Tax=Iodobacter fluviatilis TaxID=537 RepID=A0A377QAK4_9NEIS|nr:Mu transposase C-terminal domain-containing protein [Iodobacter fluviatilis]TCU81404.1 integrase-like protein [Iodobacter fluviatilis]STQ91953.1 Transposon Tn7 transposition protein tnsB [Iodobacter fluviatilis]